MTRTERILVCCGTGCIANGAYEVARALEEQIAAQGANAQVDLKVCRTGCSGECEQGPLVRLMPRDTMYYKVKPADAPAIIASLEGDPVMKLLYRDEQGVRHEHQADNPFYGLQHKVVLKDVGIIDPLSLEEYKATGGYEGLARALTMTPTRSLTSWREAACAAKAALASPRGASGVAQRATMCGRSTLCATATRATRARSWTALRWRAAPMPSSRA